MSLIKMRSFQKLSLALPRATLKSSEDTVVFIMDKNGDHIGEVNFFTGVITLYDNYVYADQVVEALRQRGETVTGNDNLED